MAEQGVIPRGVRIKGEVTAAELAIEGEVEGDIHADKLTVRGKAAGTLEAKKIVLEASSVVTGHLRAPAIVLDEGAQFSGTIQMDVGIDREL